MNIREANKHEIYYELSLVGGVGNQLFQLAHAVDKTKGESIILLTKFILNNNEAQNMPAILGFDINEVKFFFNFKKISFFQMKLHNLLLRFTSAQESSGFIWFHLIQLLQYQIVRLMQAKKIFNSVVETHLSINKFNEHKSLKHGKILQIGYFQHCNWVNYNFVNEVLHKIELKEESINFAKIRGELSNIRVLVIHMRFGDYFEVKKIGVLKPNYFKRAIRYHLDNFSYDKIVIFTNDTNLVSSMDLNFSITTRIISNQDNLSDCETLSLMRLGSGFIIANSTFSWWGAFLAYDIKAPVVYPDPWYFGMVGPNQMFPQYWVGINSVD